MDYRKTEKECVDRALAVARQTGWDVERFRIDADWDMVGMGPVGRHRDSDALARSNYTVILKDLRDRFGDAVDDVRFGHWGVGWVEEIVFDAGRVDVVKAVEEWIGTLERYPVASDEHFSQMEWDENHPEKDRYCYSDRRNHCHCDRPNVNDPKPDDDDTDDDTTTDGSDR